VKFLRYILLPIVPLYYLITWLRNVLYDIGVLKSETYPFAVICVGNLSVGGTGKTPMIEYLIALLKKDIRVATLSRGYKRKTKGFVLAQTSTQVHDIGDEPFQFFRKFNDIVVAVDANRRNGIDRLMALSPKPEVILLDDAYQHRKVQAGFNILLTPYYDLYVDDFVLPTGNLREPKSGSKRANVIVVTKCPKTLSEEEKEQVIKRLKPHKLQSVFFSSIDYADMFVGMNSEFSLIELKKKKITVVTGIANPQPMLDYLKEKGLDFEHIQYADHHNFSLDEIASLQQKQMVLTTEKDFVRLAPHFKEKENICYLPIKVVIDNNAAFDMLIKEYIKSV